MKSLKGVIAAGHTETAEAATEILRAGGNAFDAAIAAMLTACVAEPVLASLGGGGFLTACAKDQPPQLFDFFTHTPKQKRPAEDLDFYPIEADFGTASQTFHIGLGSVATPGFIRGLFSIHKHHCQLPLSELFKPAIERAKNGVAINQFQDLIATIVAPILRATPESMMLNRSPADKTRLISEGERHKQPELADFLDALQHEGERLFYNGEAGQSLIKACQHQGGHLRQEDLSDYQVVVRKPLHYTYRDAQLYTNPLPSVGGTLIAFALGLIANHTKQTASMSQGSALRLLARTMQFTQQVRQENKLTMAQILNPDIAEAYQRKMIEGGLSTRGTTQISIADAEGNLASMTLSNGEGCGYIIPNTGIMMNNMLGEEDLNPGGFHQWPEDRRLASMMSPTLIMSKNGDALVTGSGGSNRIRSAVLQVILNQLDHRMALAEAVSNPRIHFENDLLSIEPGFDKALCHDLLDEFQHQQHWKQKNLFFGGAHSVMLDHKGNLSGAGDERRGGVSRMVYQY
ncbi:MAG: gamma-glutamyltransferase [Candidatus Thiodiazotropha sp. 6PLUC2]